MIRVPERHGVMGARRPNRRSSVFLGKDGLATYFG